MYEERFEIDLLGCTQDCEERFEIDLFGCTQDCIVGFFIDEGDIDIMTVSLEIIGKINYNSKGEYVESEITDTIDIKDVLCKEQLKEIEKWVKERISDNSLDK